MITDLEEIIREKQNITRRCKRQLKRSEGYFAKRMTKLLSKHFKEIDHLSKKFDRRAKEVSSIHEQCFAALISEYDETVLKKETDIHKRTVIFPAIRKRIIAEVCEYFGLKQEQVVCEDRGDRTITECRQTIYYFFILHKLGTLKEMATEVLRDQTTIMEGIETIKNLIDTDKYYKQNFRNITERIDEVMKSFLNE